jgi:hypothetical protein
MIGKGWALLAALPAVHWLRQRDQRLGIGRPRIVLEISRPQMPECDTILCSRVKQGSSHMLGSDHGALAEHSA